MALNWNWDEKCGELIVANRTGREFVINLYQGNAYLIMINEFKNEDGEDLYDLYSFFNDKEHMRRCLGLDKKGGSYNIYDDWKRVRLNKAKFRHTKEFVSALSEAFDNISIELYSE